MKDTNHAGAATAASASADSRAKTARTCSDCPSPISRSSKGRCRPCQRRLLNSDPEIVARRLSAVAAYVSSPEGKAKSRANIRRYMANMPEADREKRREHGRRQAAEVLSRPEVRARSCSADARRRAGLAHTEKTLGWCPPHLRDEYRHLLQWKHIPAAAARQMIEATIAKEERARLAAMSPFERQMELLKKGARLVAKPVRHVTEHDFTLGGVSSGLL